MKFKILYVNYRLELIEFAGDKYRVIYGDENEFIEFSDVKLGESGSRLFPEMIYTIKLYEGVAYLGECVKLEFGKIRKCYKNDG